MSSSAAIPVPVKASRADGSREPGPVLQAHHIRQLALLAAAASWAGIFYALGFT